jgi:hypothetical protein
MAVRLQYLLWLYTQGQITENETRYMLALLKQPPGERVLRQFLQALLYSHRTQKISLPEVDWEAVWKRIECRQKKSPM